MTDNLAWSATKHDEIIKRLMNGIGQPNSQSLYGAFKQFANELCALNADAPAAKQSDFRTEVFQAAERANTRYGQWMPQRWLEIFIGEMMKEPE